MKLSQKLSETGASESQNITRELNIYNKNFNTIGLWFARKVEKVIDQNGVYLV